VAGATFCFVTGVGRPTNAPRWSVRPVPYFLMRSVYVAFLVWLGWTVMWWVIPWIWPWVWAYKWISLTLVGILVVCGLVAIGCAIGSGARPMSDFDEDPFWIDPPD